MGDDECGAIDGMSGRGNRSTRRKIWRSAAYSTTYPTRPDPGSNPGRRSRKIASKPAELRHGHLPGLYKVFQEECGSQVGVMWEPPMETSHMLGILVPVTR
jgi:hypothetical protein